MSKKILIVDDDADFVDALTTLLDAKGYSIVTANNGEDGLKKAKAESPDLILLDVMMGQRTEGFDTARKIHEDPALKNMPVIMITGIRSEMNLPFSFEPSEEWLCVKAVLEKPVKSDILLKKVEEFIRK